MLKTIKAWYKLYREHDFYNWLFKAIGAAILFVAVMIIWNNMHI